MDTSLAADGASRLRLEAPRVHWLENEGGEGCRGGLLQEAATAAEGCRGEARLWWGMAICEAGAAAGRRQSRSLAADVLCRHHCVMLGSA